MLLPLSGCAWNNDFTRMGFPNPITKQGAITLSLWQGSWVAGLLVGAVVWGMIIWAVIFPVQTVVVHSENADDISWQYFVVNAVILAGGIGLNTLGTRQRRRRLETITDS